MAMIIHHRHPEVFGGNVVIPREMFAVLQEQLGLELVTGRDPRIIARVVQAFAPDKRASRGPRPTDLTGFLGNLQP